MCVRFSSSSIPQQFIAMSFVLRQQTQCLRNQNLMAGALRQATSKGFSTNFDRFRATHRSAVLNTTCTAHNPCKVGGESSNSKRYFRSSAASRNKKNFYSVLGVPKSATKEEIKSKYRELAKKCHPDLNKDDKNAANKFRELSEAYEVLEDDSKRQMYDTYGTTDQNGGGGNPFEGFSGFGGFGGFGGFPGGGGFRQAQGEPGEDIFDVLNRAMRKQEESLGKDVKMKLKLSFLEAVNGCNKDIKYDYMGPDGKSGSVTRQTKSLNLDIPPGVDTGVTIKMSGSGVEALKGSHVGNLLIELQVEEDPYFQREGNDVLTDQHISISQVTMTTVTTDSKLILMAKLFLRRTF